MSVFTEGNSDRSQLGLAELLTAGLAHHQAGRLAEAEAHYQQILGTAPDHADALHLLGGIACQTGRPQMAMDLIGRAIKCNGDNPTYYCSYGFVLHSLNRLDEAVAAYDHALLLKADDCAALINRGLALEALERFGDALESYDRVLTIAPDYIEAVLNRGNALQQLGRFADALESYDRALALNPDLAEAHFNREEALKGLKRLGETAASCNRDPARNPDSAEALFARGNALCQAGRWVEALEIYDRALSLGPGDAAVYFIRGNILLQLGRFTDALESYDRALALKPDLAEALLNRGNALLQLGRFGDALESYDQALTFRPDYLEAHVNQGNALMHLGNMGEALESYGRALRLSPNYVEALINRGLAFQKLHRVAEALESYDRALALKPDDPAALFNQGIAFQSQGKLDEAITSFSRAASRRPDGYALTEWFNAKQRICDWSNYRESEARVRDAIKARVSLSAPFALLALSSTPEEQLDCARRVAAGISARVTAISPSRKPRQFGKVRLGYLSADFRQHALAILMAGLIEHHDRERFEVIGYSYGADDGSALRSRLEAAFDRFADISDMPHRLAAELIHGDAVDILIDLTGYAGNGRPEILAYRPAPIQVNYLGYPGTMGADFIDYIIADPFVVPTDQQAFFSERLVHLPGCYQCNDDKREISARTPSRAECGLPDAGFVFCCFNNTYKITPAVFDIWMRLLTAVPDSVLWLLPPWEKGAVASTRANLAREAAARGVASERLVFGPHLPLPDHLARHRCADLFLDTLPCNAHTTASDALWSGLPLLTCVGDTFAGRVAGSLLRAVGLEELATTSLEEYEKKALRLARDAELLASLRQRLSENRRTCPLFDTEGQTRNMESAYWQMWQRWRAGRPATPFSIP